MDQHYLEQFTNQRLEEQLLQRKHILLLEDLLDRENKTFARLEKLRKKSALDFGLKVCTNKLIATARQVEVIVDRFLNVHYAGTCNYTYLKFFDRPRILSSLISTGAVGSAIPLALEGNYQSALSMSLIGLLWPVAYLTSLKDLDSSCYHRKSKLIELDRVKKFHIYSTIGHEYAHHVQEEVFRETMHEEEWKVIRKKLGVVCEGHARGVGKYIAKFLREQEDNEAYLYRDTKIKAEELEWVYRWLCKRVAIQPRTSLLRTSFSTRILEGVYGVFTRKPTKHAMGATLFSLYEATLGPSIYRDMVHGTFTFSH